MTIDTLVIGLPLTIDSPNSRSMRIKPLPNSLKASTFFLNLSIEKSSGYRLFISPKSRGREPKGPLPRDCNDLKFAYALLCIAYAGILEILKYLKELCIGSLVIIACDDAVTECGSK